MKAVLAALFLALAASNPSETAISYFTNVRQVQVKQPDRQNYFVVDEEIWNHSRPDLGDLRLYSGDSPIQYSLSEQRAETSSDEVEAKILNLGTVAGHTEFDLDAQGISAYDRIRLRLDAKDFVVTASVAGSNELGQPSATELPPTTLYDFTTEQLGRNFIIKFPPSSFRYLHIKLSGQIHPQQIKGAAIFNLHEQPASWTKVGFCKPPEQQPRVTVIVCNVPPKVPLNRIQFQVAANQVNFRRAVTVEIATASAEQNAEAFRQATGEISRVRVNRAGTLVTAEEMAVSIPVGFVPEKSSGEIKISVNNEDNPALTIADVQALSLERRIYFDPQGKSSLELYYGDEKLTPPIYDYARFFRLDAAPAQADLAAGLHNPQYTGRADDRPWSDRHVGILWAGMILAVITLLGLAVRGLRPGAKP